MGKQRNCNKVQSAEIQILVLDALFIYLHEFKRDA